MKHGYEKDFSMITNLLSNETFLSTDYDKDDDDKLTQSEKVIDKYKLKGPLKLNQGKYLSQQIVEDREIYIFNILSQALGIIFSPHKIKYDIQKIENTNSAWKTYYKSYKKK